MITTTEWMPVKLSELFDIKKGKRLTKADQTVGDTIFIGATALKNGITNKIGQDAIHEGNTISLTYNGSIGEAFYQPEPFWASDDVNVLYPKDFELTQTIGLFFCTILRHEKQMWSYARKWNLEHMNATVVKVPMKDGHLDTEYIETYMNSLDGEVSDIPDYFLADGYDKACWYLDNIDQESFESKYAGACSDIQVSLSRQEWDCFRFGDIVDDIHNGKSYNASDLVVSDNDDYVAYITRTDENNGISMYVQNDDYQGKEKAGAITIGDTTATAFYQTVDFITGPHIIVVRASWFNVYTALFIISLLNLEKYRYPVFGRAFTKDLIKETTLYLPVDEDGKPDYKYMEEYIKGCAFSCNIV